MPRPVGLNCAIEMPFSNCWTSGLLPLHQSRAEGAIPFRERDFDPSTMTFVEVGPDNALTWSLPYRYEPAADCPTIKQWLRDAVDGDEATLEFCAHGWRPSWSVALIYKKFLHLLGPGGTGKGTSSGWLPVDRERNRTITDLRNLETNRFETASLYGKTAASSPIRPITEVTCPCSSR